MSASRFTTWVVAILAIMLMSAQVSAQGQPKLPKEKVSSAGEIKAIEKGIFHVKNIGGDEWYIRVEAVPKDVFMKGEAEPSWLQTGMPVEFSGLFLTNRKGEPSGKAREPITKLKVFSSREDLTKKANAPVAAAPPVGVAKAPKKGSFLVGTKPKEEEPENTASFVVKGMLRNAKGGRMTVTTGKTTYTADLAADAKITVNISDYRFARAGDELEFEGWYIPGQKKYVHATSVWITAATILSGDKKTGRQVVASKTTPTTQKTSSSVPTADQRRAITELSQEIASAGKLFEELKIAEAVDVVKTVQAKMGELTGSGNPTVGRLLKSPYARLSTLHALLEMEGYKMPPLVDPNVAEK